MPNIFPPISLQAPARDTLVGQSDPVAIPSVLGSVGATPASAVALVGAQNDLQAAKDKMTADTPKKYDYSAHSVLGNVGHVLGRFGNIAGDILDPEATARIPGSDLNTKEKLATDQANVDKATTNQAGAQRESDSVANETANRDQSEAHFQAEAPEREASLASTNANTLRAQQETAASVAQNKPLDDTAARTLNQAWGTNLFTPGMAPAEVARLSTAHEKIAQLTQQKQESDARLAESTQAHRDTESDRAQSRDIARQNHQDTMESKTTATQEKQNKPYNQMIDDIDQAHEFAKQGTGYGDYGLVMKYVDATKPSSGFRFNQTEAKQIYGAASIADKFRRAYESGAHGDNAGARTARADPPGT